MICKEYKPKLNTNDTDVYYFKDFIPNNNIDKESTNHTNHHSNTSSNNVFSNSNNNANSTNSFYRLKSWFQNEFWINKENFDVSITTFFHYEKLKKLKQNPEKQWTDYNIAHIISHEDILQNIRYFIKTLIMETETQALFSAWMRISTLADTIYGFSEKTSPDQFINGELIKYQWTQKYINTIYEEFLNNKENIDLNKLQQNAQCLEFYLNNSLHNLRIGHSNINYTIGLYHDIKITKNENNNRYSISYSDKNTLTKVRNQDLITSPPCIHNGHIYSSDYSQPIQKNLLTSDSKNILVENREKDLYHTPKNPRNFMQEIQTEQKARNEHIMKL